MTSRDLCMIYREIPATSACKTGCLDCCGPVAWSSEEFARVEADVPAIAQWIEVAGVKGLLNPLTGRCPFASSEGCQVYERRPFICRLYASSIDDTRLRCPHGVRPTHPLSAARAASLTDRYVHVSRSSN